MTLQERLRGHGHFRVTHQHFANVADDCDQAADRIDALERENTALREAANDAATSLETIGGLSGKASYIGEDGKHIPTYMGHHHEVRAYAAARASAARAALAALDKALGGGS